MSGLKDYLNKTPLNLIKDCLNSTPHTLEKLKMLARKIDLEFSGISLKEPSQYDLETSFQNVKQFHSNKKYYINTLSRKDIRRVPWLLYWKKLSDGSYLGDSIDFMAFYFSLPRVRKNSTTIVALFNIFLKYYPKANREFWFKRLHEMIFSHKSPKVALLKERCEKTPFLKKESPEVFGKMMFDRHRYLQEFYDSVGIDEKKERSCFIKESFSYFLQSLVYRFDQRLFENIDIVSIFNLITPQPTIFIFNELTKDIVEALLLPFINNDPPLELKEKIKEFLLNNLGHPAVNKGNWNNKDISQGAKSVFLSWLTHQALEDFFLILDKTADDHQWRYRKAFWNAVLKRKLIRKAWVILGSRGRNALRRSNIETSGYATLSDASSDQSVILMEIGQFIIAEWSHSGACRIWNINRQGIPEMFKPCYHSTYLRNENYIGYFKHTSSERGGWQKNISDFLRKNLGVWVAKQEYMPSED